MSFTWNISTLKTKFCEIFSKINLYNPDPKRPEKTDPWPVMTWQVGCGSGSVMTWQGGSDYIQYITVTRFFLSVCWT